MERIDKFLSNLKYGSREDIKKAVKNKLVRVNNLIIKDPSLKIDPNKDQVMFKESIVFYKENVSLMMNKPKGYVCATTDNEHKTVLELLKEPYNRLDFKIIGRLDKDTEGLLFLTTNTELVRKYTHPKHDFMKKYYCKLQNKIENLELLNNGIEIKDKDGEVFLTKEAITEQISDYEAYISISEGKFHQVKRMFEYINNKVIYLKRVEVNNIRLDENLKLGEYKEIDLD